MKYGLWLLCGVVVFILVWNIAMRIFRRRQAKKKYLFGCGHYSQLKKKMEVFGEPITYEGSKDHLETCPECLLAMATRCAWCGRPIFIDDPITLYVPTKPGFQIPEYAVRYGEPPEGHSHPALVGCLGWNCAETGMDRAGFWVRPGKVQRVASPMEVLVARMKNGDDTPFIVNNLRDQSQAIPIPDEIANPKR